MAHIAEGALALVAAAGWLAWLYQRYLLRPEGQPDSSIRTFRKRVLAAHASAFRLHTEVLGLFEDALLRERNATSRFSVATDMLMYQALKSDGTVSLLAQHGLLEDAATIARRLMELAVQSLYLWADGDTTLQEQRANRYLAHMWRQLPPRALDQMPEEIKTQWRAIDADVGDSLPANAKRWGPRWDRMFAEVGASEMYREDYSLLSNMAHGSPDDLVIRFSLTRIRVHRHEHAWVVLWYATKYFVIVAGMWNNAFAVIPDAQVKAVLDRVHTWKRPAEED
jgi:hypothetical protein